MTSADFATDAAAAVGFLRTRADIDRAAIGLIGGEPGADDQCNPHAVVPVLAGQLNEQSSEFKKIWRSRRVVPARDHGRPSDNRV